MPKDEFLLPLLWRGFLFPFLYLGDDCSFIHKLEWQVHYRFFFAGKQAGHQGFGFCDVLYLFAVLVIHLYVFYFFATLADCYLVASRVTINSDSS